MEMTLVRSEGDWEALYIDGKKELEGHKIRRRDIMSYVDEFLYEEIWDEVPEGMEHEGFPEFLEDLNVKSKTR